MFHQPDDMLLYSRHKTLCCLLLIFHQSVDMMLCSVLRGGHLKYVGHAEQGLLRVPVGDHLEDCEVLQHTVHHVLLGKMLQLQYEVDHVFTHWTAVNFVQVTTAFITGALSFHLFHHLFAETADFCGALNCHIFVTLVPAIKCFTISWNIIKTVLQLLVS